MDEDGDFRVKKGGDIEQVEESSESDDFVERTQNKKKKKVCKKPQAGIAKKYQSLNLKPLTKADFKITTVIHAKHKVKLSDSARIQKIHINIASP